MLVTTSISLGIIAIVALIIIPSIRYIQNIKHDIEFTEAQLEENYQKMKLLKKSFQEVYSIKEETNKFNYITVKKGEELNIIRELERLAELHHISQTISVSLNEKPVQTDDKTDATKKRPHYIFSFKNEGTFKDHLAYLEALEHLPYYILIDGMNFVAAPKSGRVNLTFTGIIYISNN